MKDKGELVPHTRTHRRQEKEKALRIFCIVFTGGLL